MEKRAENTQRDKNFIRKSSKRMESEKIQGKCVCFEREGSAYTSPWFIGMVEKRSLEKKEILRAMTIVILLMEVKLRREGSDKKKTSREMPKQRGKRKWQRLCSSYYTLSLSLSASWVRGRGREEEVFRHDVDMI